METYKEAYENNFYQEIFTNNLQNIMGKKDQKIKMDVNWTYPEKTKQKYKKTSIALYYFQKQECKKRTLQEEPPKF